MFTVFVVDDSPATRASVAMALESGDHNPIEPASTDDALAPPKRGDVEPGLIIVDRTMPRLVEPVSAADLLRTVGHVCPNT